MEKLNKTNLKKTVPIVAGLMAGILLTCTTQTPVSPDGLSGYNLLLSVGRKGVYEADFTGTPVRAILTLSDSVEFNRIDWFTGAGQQILPDVSWNQRLNSVEVALYWAGNIPKVKDSVTGIPYDTVFVKVGLDRSNPVRVNVINRAPIIDSIIIGDTSIAVKEKVYGEDVYHCELDSAGTIPLRLLVNDFDYEDRNILNVAWRSRDSSRIQYDRFVNSKGIFEAEYKTPTTNFRDTIFAGVLDGRGGNTRAAVVLYRRNGPSAVSIDSVKIGNSTVYDEDTLIVHEVVSLDSLDIKVFTRSKNLRIRWQAVNKGALTALDSAEGYFSARYYCSASHCKDTLVTDTTITLDDILLVMNDQAGGESRLHFRILKVPQNKRPSVDSISIDRQIFPVDSTVLHKTFGVTDTVELKAFYHDTDEADQGALQGSWESRLGIIETISSGAARYIALDSSYIDTVTYTVRDPLGFKKKQDIEFTVSYFPVIDSISIKDTTLIPQKNQTLNHFATLQDTMEIVVWARDPSGGVPTVEMINKNKSMVSKTGNNTFRYLTTLPETDVDSASIVVYGKDSLTTKLPLILSIKNRKPSIDSILVNDELFKSTDPVYSYEATVLDTISFRAFSHDPDSESVVFSWEMQGENQSPLNTEEYPFAVYRCLDSLYQDTVVLTARDETGGVNEKRIQILVNNSFPVIDSMLINDIVFVSAGRDDTLFTYESMAPDTIAFQAFAHDPDDGDVASPEWQFRDHDHKLRVFKDRPAIEYVSADSSYIDTVILRVRDSRDAFDWKKVLLVFTK